MMAYSGDLRKAAQADLRTKIRQLSADRGWTLADAARRSGVSYSKLTQGLAANRWFLPDEVLDLADTFEVSEDELLGESLYKEDARGSKFDRPRPGDIGADVGSGYGRALCCDCGTFRRFREDEVDYTSTRIHDLDTSDPLGRRMVLTLACRTCDRRTMHAELRVHGEHQDCAEEINTRPTKEQEAAQRRDEVIERIAGFNVDVHWGSQGQKKRAEGYVVSYEYDESKSRWRIEVDPNIPARVQASAIVTAWTKIASDNHGDLDWDPKNGVTFKMSDTVWEGAVDDLVADIHQALPAEQQRLRLALVDEFTQDSESRQ